MALVGNHCLSFLASKYGIFLLSVHVWGTVFIAKNCTAFLWFIGSVGKHIHQLKGLLYTHNNQLNLSEQ